VDARFDEIVPSPRREVQRHADQTLFLWMRCARFAVAATSIPRADCRRGCWRRSAGFQRNAWMHGRPADRGRTCSSYRTPRRLENLWLRGIGWTAANAHGRRGEDVIWRTWRASLAGRPAVDPDPTPRTASGAAEIRYKTDVEFLSRDGTPAR